jgi:hypothetical protein
MKLRLERAGHLWKLVITLCRRRVFLCCRQLVCLPVTKKHGECQSQSSADTSAKRHQIRDFQAANDGIVSAICMLWCLNFGSCQSLVNFPNLQYQVSKGQTASHRNFGVLPASGGRPGPSPMCRMLGHFPSPATYCKQISYLVLGGPPSCARRILSSCESVLKPK